MNNIVLIGMPGCGKSSAGVLLAKTLEKDFVDTDLLIQKCEGMSLQEIIDTRGNAYFRDVEDAVLMSFDGDNYVVATGGSAVYCHAAMEKFRQDGDTIVYIKVTAPEIIKRLRIPLIATNIGDGRTLVIHPASTIYAHANKKQRENAGVYDDTIRISVGIEDIKGLKDDFYHSIKSIGG